MSTTVTQSTVIALRTITGGFYRIEYATNIAKTFTEAATIDVTHNDGRRRNCQTNKPAMHPETHESNVLGIYLAGVMIGGNATGEIFIENGRVHGKQIVKALAGV